MRKFCASPADIASECRGEAMNPGRITLVGAALAGAATAQVAEDAVQRVERRLRELDSTSRLEPAAGTPLAERTEWDFGGSLGWSAYAIDDSGSRSHILRQADARAWFRAEIDGRHRFFGRLRLRYDDWNSGDDFDGQGDDLREPIGERWWYEYDAGPLRARLGKQHVEIGNGVALSGALTGASAALRRDAFELRLLAADTPVNDWVDFDASRPGFDTHTMRRFLALAVEGRGGDVTPFAHVIRQADRNDRDETVFIDGLGQIYDASFDYDSTYWGIGARGPLSSAATWRFEFDLETGKGISSPISGGGVPGPQHREAIIAWALVGGASWSLRDAANSRVDAELIAASGDDDRLDSADTFGGSRTGTTDRGFNGFGFLDTGLALAPDPSNLLVLRAGLETSPWRGDARMERLRAVATGYLFTKLDPDAPINLPTVRQRFVGGEIDLGLDWNVRPDLTLSARLGFFIPGGAMPDGEDGTRQVLFGGVTDAF
jgi:hypothetical protein